MDGSAQLDITMPVFDGIRGESRQDMQCIRTIVGQSADDGGKPKLLLDAHFEFPKRVWARCLLQIAVANVTGRDMHNNARGFTMLGQVHMPNPFGAKWFGSPSSALARQN